MYVCLYVCMYVCAFMHACIHACMYAYEGCGHAQAFEHAYTMWFVRQLRVKEQTDRLLEDPDGLGVKFARRTLFRSTCACCIETKAAPFVCVRL